MSRKKPTPSGLIVTTGTPIGLNRIIKYLSEVISANFNTIDSTFPDNTLVKEPILHVFGLADKYEDKSGVRYPVGYNSEGGTGTDPINLLPTDRWHGYCFFDYDDPLTFESPADYMNTSRHWGSVTAKLSIIFFFNMKRQRYFTKWGTDYRMQKETLAQRLLRLLTVESPRKGCQFKITSIIDRSIDAVFKGYTLDEAKAQGNLQPYYAIRFETEVSYTQTCDVNANFIEVLPSRNGVWRILNSTTDLIVEKSVNGAWVEKGRFK